MVKLFSKKNNFGKINQNTYNNTGGRLLKHIEE